MKPLIYRHLTFILILILPIFTFGQRGKNGDVTIGSSTIVNEYTTLAVDVSVGALSIVVTSNNLNANNRFPAPLAAGDLIMIIQVQGASLNPSNSSSWGAVLNYNNCGRYELAQVQSVSGTDQIILSCGLQNSYTASGRVQVVRVPRYNTLTVQNGGSISCPDWNGSTGGIVSVEVLGTCQILSGGNFNVSGKGFRGGELLENNSDWGVLQYMGTTGNFGAEKGEGIGGYKTDYNALGGMFCRGAAANAGGGGNGHNAGGGGGGNGGSTSLWTGNGNPDISNSGWVNAWNAESSGFANSSSTGGGRGGYTYSWEDLNAQSVGPHPSGGTAWGGDWRRVTGGLGGRPLDYSSGRLFLGGGGGAGDQNDNDGGEGGDGGGLIYIRAYADISGSGSVLANGNNGQDATGSTPFSGVNGNDGAGGGGAGGTVILNADGTVSGISVQVNGGNGGDQEIKYSLFSNNTEAEGPGGGAGGGYVAISNGSLAVSANGGANGVTNSVSLTEFPPNGATRGGAGTTNASVSSFQLFAVNDTICSGMNASLSVTVSGTLPSGASLEWYSAPFGGTVLGTGLSYTLTNVMFNTTLYVGTCPGTYRVPVEVIIVPFTPNAGSDVSICTGGSATLNASGGTTYSWSPASGLNTISGPNPIASPIDTTTYTVVITNQYGCSGTDQVIVNVGDLQVDAGLDTFVCLGGSVQLNGAGGTQFNWAPASSLSNSSTQNPLATPAVNTVYTVTISDGSGCTGVDSVFVEVKPLPQIDAGIDQGICLGDTANLNAIGNGSFLWSPAATLGNPNSASTLAFPLTTTTYSVTLTDVFGCSAADDVEVEVYPLPVVNLGQDTSICEFTNITLDAGSGFDYLWSDGSTTQTIQAANNTFWVNVTDGNACSASDTINIGMIPQADATINAAGPFCEEVGLIVLSAATSGGSWSGNGITDPNGGGFSPTWAGPGDHMITYIIPDPCGDQDTVIIRVFETPTADLVAVHESCENAMDGSIDLTPSGGIMPYSYEWNTGDTIEDLVDLIPGYYSVTITDGNACSSTSDVNVDASLDPCYVPHVYVPNIFSPDGNQQNDTLYVRGRGVLSFNMKIYDRWGKKVFETNSLNNGWDGTRKGKLATRGVYVYYLEAKLENGEEVKEEGTITIVR